MVSLTTSNAGWTAESLITEIERLTKSKWSEDSYPLLLSDLGSELDKSGDYRSVISPLKLRQFIATRMSAEVTIVTHPHQRQKIALLPAGEVFSFTDIVANTQPSVRPKSEKIRPSIWAAFVKPLAVGAERFVNMDELNFIDLPESEKPPFPNFKVVPRSLIVDGKSPDYNADLVAKTIASWASENAVAEDSLRNRPQNDNRLGGKLFEAFRGLSDSDLRRIEIPFDIVMKLLNK